MDKKRKIEIAGVAVLYLAVVALFVWMGIPTGELVPILVAVAVAMGAALRVEHRSDGCGRLLRRLRRRS